MSLPTSRQTLVFLCIVALAGGLYFVFHDRWERSAVFVRPDGRYQVVVMRHIPLLPTMPGQAGDAPGEIVIEDRDGRILHRQKVTMVQTVDAVEWGDRKASVKLQGEWSLPD